MAPFACRPKANDTAFVKFAVIPITLASGVIAGVATSFFLWTLHYATLIHNHSPWLIWGLPFAGLLIVFIDQKWGLEARKGTSLILREIREPRKHLPWLMAPLIWFGTIVTHLFGGSAGREGTAVQMSASLADQWSRLFALGDDDRRLLLTVSLGAGFGAAIGAPWAGLLFGIEVTRRWRARPLLWILAGASSWTAHRVAVFLETPHSSFPSPTGLDHNLNTWFSIIVAAIFFGVTAKAFLFLVRFCRGQFSRWISRPLLRPFAGGVLLAVLYSLEGSGRYTGLGLPVIMDSFSNVSAWTESAYKIFFTTLTLGSGFKGGEFIPLVFVGATLGSALGGLLPASNSLLAALGCASVFGAAVRAPLACAVMAIELFGLAVAPFVFPCAIIAAIVTRSPGYAMEAD